MESPRVVRCVRRGTARRAGARRLQSGGGLDYRLTAAGSIVEGTWDQLMDLAKSCHQSMRGRTERVITLIKVDDYEKRTGRLTAAVKSVEDKVGKPVKKGA